MKKLMILITVMTAALVGCSQEKTYSVWIDSTQGAELVDSAVQRLTDADVDFILDDHGSVLVNEKEFSEAIMCCS